VVLMEYAALQAALGRSSSRRHAAPLLHAYEVLARIAGAATFANLFLTFPTYLGPVHREDSDGEPAWTITCNAMKAGKRQNGPTFAVFYDGTLTAAAIRPSSNKFKLATCCHLSSKSRPWECIHAKAGNKMPRVHAASEAVRALIAREVVRPLGPDGVLNEQKTAAAGRAEALPSAAAPATVELSKPLQPRRPKNMFYSLGRGLAVRRLQRRRRPPAARTAA